MGANVRFDQAGIQAVKIHSQISRRPIDHQGLVAGDINKVGSRCTELDVHLTGSGVRSRKFSDPPYSSMRIAFIALFPRVSDNMFLLVGIIARDESQNGFGGAKIDGLMRDVGVDINEPESGVRTFP